MLNSQRRSPRSEAERRNREVWWQLGGRSDEGPEGSWWSEGSSCHEGRQARGEMMVEARARVEVLNQARAPRGQKARQGVRLARQAGRGARNQAERSSMGEGAREEAKAGNPAGWEWERQRRGCRCRNRRFLQGGRCIAVAGHR